jgi:hypothetical protein
MSARSSNSDVIWTTIVSTAYYRDGVVGGLEVCDLEAEVLHAEVLLHAERHREGDPTHGVGRLAGDNAEEGLITFCQPLEVEVHLLQGADKDDVESASSIDEGLREQSAFNYGLDDEQVRHRIWDVNLVISPGERYRLLRPTQGMRWIGVDELDLTLILAVPPPARAGLQAANDHVDRPLGLLE